MKLIRIYTRRDHQRQAGVVETIETVHASAFSLRTAMEKARKLARVKHHAWVQRGDRRGFNGRDGHFYYVHLAEAERIDTENQKDAGYPR